MQLLRWSKSEQKARKHPDFRNNLTNVESSAVMTHYQHFWDLFATAYNTVFPCSMFRVSHLTVRWFPKQTKQHPHSLKQHVGGQCKDKRRVVIRKSLKTLTKGFGHQHFQRFCFQSQTSNSVHRYAQLQHSNYWQCLYSNLEVFFTQVTKSLTDR